MLIMSGRLSSCSVLQDEHLAEMMHKTPGTPMKSGLQTPKKSDRKRALFGSQSPTNSEDLGLLSPISSTASSFAESLQSPQFSPNGEYSTPVMCLMSVRSSPRLLKKLDVKSSLFPALKSYTPKVVARTPKRTKLSQAPTLTPTTQEAMSVLKDMIDDEATTPRSSKAAQGGCVSESPCETVPGSPKVSKLGVLPISSDSFYGAPCPQTPKRRSTLVIDSLDRSKAEARRVRSLSRESAANRSFVSGSGQRKRTSSGGSRRSKGPHAGVWHGVKKPKKMKKPSRVPKPIISPDDRVAQIVEMFADERKKSRLFPDKPRGRNAAKKRNFDEVEVNGIIDPFPYRTSKRLRLPSGARGAPQPAERSPDPSKKFMKHGGSVRATFTLYDHVKVQISNGSMKLQSPRKKKATRRRLYSPSRGGEVDFNDVEDETSAIEANVQDILKTLQGDREVAADAKRQLLSPCKVQVEKISDSQLFHILDSPSTKVSMVEATPSKMIALVHPSPNRLLTNLSTLALDGPRESPEAPSRAPAPVMDESLALTGSFITTAAGVLNPFPSTPPSPPSPHLSAEEDSCHAEDTDRLYSLFYKENWPKGHEDKMAKGSSSAKKCAKWLPDDQYLLDAGQKSVGIVTCAKCGVMYQAGDFADEAAHKNFHDNLPELRFMGWANERVVKKFEDGRVILVLGTDAKPWWHKVYRIVEVVDKDLGFPEVCVKTLHNTSVYLYISSKAKQVVGCLIAEECKTAYKMFPPLEGVEVDSCSEEPSPCEVGVSRIWTALSHRRRGVATRLIHCMRKSFVYGKVVPLDKVAFSSPSPQGKVLAQRVMGRHDFLVYGFS